MRGVGESALTNDVLRPTSRSAASCAASDLLLIQGRISSLSDDRR